MSTRFSPSSRFGVPSLAPRRTSASTIVGLVVLVLLIIVGAAFVLGFSLMILCGILWAEFGWLAPIGIAPAFGIALFGSIVAAPFRAKVNAST